MSHNSDRDPTNPARLGALVHACVALAGPSPAHQDPATWAEAQEHVAGLLFAELLDQGVLTPAEHEGCYLDGVADVGCAVSVRVTGLGWVQVDGAGSADVIPE